MNLIERQQNKQTANRHFFIEQLKFIPGIWVNGKYYWMQNTKEKIIYDEELIIKVKREQVHSKIEFSGIYAGNHSSQAKEIKVLAMHHSTNIQQDNLTFISPADNRIFHISDQRVYLVNASFDGCGIKEYTTIPLWSAFTDQIWSSVQNGVLKYQPMAKGPAASIFTIKMVIHPHETCKMNTWTIEGSDKKEVIAMEEALSKKFTD